MKMHVKKVAALAVAAFGMMLASADAAFLTYDLRAPDGSKSVILAGTGSSVTLNLFAVLQNGNANAADDGFTNGGGSFKSTVGGVGLNLGSLSPVANVNGFNAVGATPGLAQDLDGDGDLDVGSTSPTSATDYFTALSLNNPNPTLNMPAGGFLIGQVMFTVTDAAAGSTQVNFVQRVKTNVSTSVHRGQSDAAAFNLPGTSAEIVVGSPVSILVPEPTAIGMLAAGLAGLLARRRA